MNCDTVGDAFNNYLTTFDLVANLDVLSGYHDEVDIELGLTYLIGRSPIDEQAFYWRSVDHNKARDGMFSANIWTDWHKIDCGLNPYMDVVRPVIRDSRLHIIWLERIEQGDAANGTTTTNYCHVLKLSHLRYDGTWSSPISYPVDAYLKGLALQEGEAPGLYCAEELQTGHLTILLYKKTSTPKSAQINGFRIGAGFDMIEMSATQALDYRSNLYHQFDSTSQRRINNQYHDGDILPVAITVADNFEYGEVQTGFYDGPITKAQGGRMCICNTAHAPYYKLPRSGLAAPTPGQRLTTPQ